MTAFKIMSYNIHSGIGMDGVFDMNRIVGVIRQAGADMIGLQEADVHWGPRSRFGHTVEELAQALGMFYYTAPVYDLPPQREGEPSRQFGVAVLSRFPIVRAANHRLTRLSTQDREAPPTPMPGFAETVLDVDGAAVTVYVTHLDYRPDPALRQLQVTEMLDIVGDSSGKLLLGDFNAGPEAPELERLFERFGDTWSIRGSEPGLTFPADEPRSKIDYILAGDGLRVTETSVIESQASDHRPIVASLKIEL